MTPEEALRVLGERRDYLTARIEAKKKVGWSWEYDAKEHEALCQIIEMAWDHQKELENA